MSSDCVFHSKIERQRACRARIFAAKTANSHSQARSDRASGRSVSACTPKCVLKLSHVLRELCDHLITSLHACNHALAGRVSSSPSFSSSQYHRILISQKSRVFMQPVRRLGRFNEPIIMYAGRAAVNLKLGITIGSLLFLR